MAFAKKGLPCTIIPMPLSGGNCPVTPAANVAMATAEVLGAFTALRAYEPGARVVGGAISGVMDMSSGGALFGDPGAILQDRLLSQHFEHCYGMDFGIGTGYIDAPVPGVRSVIEKTCKMASSYRCRKTNYPVGIIEAGKTFSPVQAMLDLEVARRLHACLGGVEVNEETLAVDVVREAGIGGNVLAHDHTLEHFRDVLCPGGFLGASGGSTDALLDSAGRKWQDVAANAEPYELPGDKAEEIDRIVARAEKFFEEK
jgi:trimethylamine--corrinoid protein Co-methyltransferase